jgi:hypothetical protein
MGRNIGESEKRSLDDLCSFLFGSLTLEAIKYSTSLLYEHTAALPHQSLLQTIALFPPLPQISLGTRNASLPLHR